MLDEYQTLLDELKNKVAMQTIQAVEFESASELYCPACRKFRRIHIKLITKYSQLPQELLEYNYALAQYENRAKKKKGLWDIFKKREPGTPPKLDNQQPPALFMYTCLQCEMKFVALLHLANNEPALIVLPNKIGGLATPNTPVEVAYYANEGHKASCVNAVTVAIAMYRATLEKLLEERGYTGGLKQKVLALEADVVKGTGKPWTKFMDVELIKVLKELGDSSMHASDYSKKLGYDRPLAAKSQLALTMVLHAVYEKGVADQALLVHLKLVIAGI